MEVKESPLQLSMIRQQVTKMADERPQLPQLLQAAKLKAATLQCTSVPSVVEDLKNQKRLADT